MMDERKLEKLKGKVSETRLKQDIARLNFHQATTLQSLERDRVNVKSDLVGLQFSSGHLKTKSVLDKAMRQESGVSKAVASNVRKSSHQAKERTFRCLSSKQQPHAIEHIEMNNNTSKRKEPRLRNSKSGEEMSKLNLKKSAETISTAAGKGETTDKRLPSIFVANRGKQLAPTFIQDDEIAAYVPQKDLHKRDASPSNMKSRLRSNSGGEKDQLLLPEARTMSRSEQSLPTAWYNSVDLARSNISKRLSKSMITLETLDSPNLNDNSENYSSISLDVSAYLFAPPDGLPRTMFILPNADERFAQAKQARYIRKPGTKVDPVENELDLHDIFQGLNQEENKSV